MTYRLEKRLFVENGPTVMAARARSLSSARALHLVRKQAPANDFIDEYPVAL